MTPRKSPKSRPGHADRTGWVEPSDEREEPCDSTPSWPGNNHWPGVRRRWASILLSSVAHLSLFFFCSVGLDPSVYGTHSLRRTKATLIYKRTGNLRAVQLLLGHTKIESTVATWASRSTTPLKLRSKSTSDDTGWSGHALPSRRRGVRANKRHSEAQPRVGTVFRVGNICYAKSAVAWAGVKPSTSVIRSRDQRGR